MQKETWAFIDYENISTLEGIEFSKLSKIYVFIGAKQNKINLGNEKINLLTEIHLLKLKTTSPDNLDFHISYYLGKFDALADKNIEFIVVSNDTGFDPLIKHLKDNGRICNRKKLTGKVEPASQINTNTQPSQVNEALQLKLVKTLASTHIEKRPKTEATLKNFTKSHLGLHHDNVGAQREFSKLVKSGLVKVEGKKVKYHL